MALTINSGPCVTSGNINPTILTDPDTGPSLNHQGSGLTDPRYVGTIGTAPGQKVVGIYSCPYVCLLDAIPVAANTARIAALQALTALTPMTLVAGVNPGTAANVPITPYGSTPGTVVNVMALDFGFCPGNTTAGSPTLTLPVGAWKFFNKGERIIVMGAGAGGGPLVTVVAANPVPNSTTITMADNAVTTKVNAQVGSAHYQYNVAWPYAVAGAIALGDYTQMVSRAVCITGTASSVANTFTVRGYDIYGQLMTEVITFPGGAVTTNGKKAFKYITSVTPTTTDANTASVGTTDILGMSLRTDFWEYMNVFVSGAFLTASTGWTVADATLPATTTTGDVRGTYALQTASNWDGLTASWAASRRAAVFSSLPMYNCIGANNLNFATLFGNTQV